MNIHLLNKYTLEHLLHQDNSNDIDDKQVTITKEKKFSFYPYKKFPKIYTGGSGTEPVIVAYCLKISLGVGPIKKKASNIPDSNIQ